MSKILISTAPFGDINKLPIELLDCAGVDYICNPYNRKLKELELIDLIRDCDVLIAGTETITKKVMDNAPNLKFISRVGIGLDELDLLEAKNRGIGVSYTPDAPAPAVAELTIGLMISLLRSVHTANLQFRKGQWHRYFGRRIAEITIGIIGAGRIGGRVLRRLSAFGSPRILVNDINPNLKIAPNLKLEWVDKNTIFSQADLISIHTPLTLMTKNMIKKEQLMLMKKDAMLINTSRGGIINEDDLFEVLKQGHLSGVAIDVFNNEPYFGNLSEFDRCLLTAHMGSMSIDCRSRMEIEATEEALRFLQNKPLQNSVPEYEYDIQKGVNSNE